MKMLNNKGDNTQPCFTPVFSNKHSDNTPLTLTFALVFSYRLLTILTIFPEIPYIFIASHSNSRFTESYAFGLLSRMLSLDLGVSRDEDRDLSGGGATSVVVWR